MSACVDACAQVQHLYKEWGEPLSLAPHAAAKPSFQVKVP